MFGPGPIDLIERRSHGYSGRLVGSACWVRRISANSRSSRTSAANSEAGGATSGQLGTAFVPGISARWLSSGKCCAYLLASSISRPPHRIAVFQGRSVRPASQAEVRRFHRICLRRRFSSHCAAAPVLRWVGYAGTTVMPYNSKAPAAKRAGRAPDGKRNS